MTIEDLAAKVIAVLNAQERYFKSRDRADLIASKRQERELRAACDKILGTQKALF